MTSYTRRQPSLTRVLMTKRPGMINHHVVGARTHLTHSHSTGTVIRNCGGSRYQVTMCKIIVIFDIRTLSHFFSGQVRSGQAPLQGAVRPCRWWRGLSNRSEARGDAGGSFVLLAGSPMPARLERTGEKQRTVQPSGSTTVVVARELANPGEIRATVG
jgi:hypothetical protein